MKVYTVLLLHLLLSLTPNMGKEVFVVLVGVSVYEGAVPCILYIDVCNAIIGTQRL